MARVKTQTPNAVQLFKTKHGSVHAVVIGPEIGWRWRRVKYYHSKRSTKVPGAWDEITDDWGKHNPSLIRRAAEENLPAASPGWFDGDVVFG